LGKYFAAKNGVLLKGSSCAFWISLKALLDFINKIGSHKEPRKTLNSRGESWHLAQVDFPCAKQKGAVDYSESGNPMEGFHETSQPFSAV
jgi:hypothetical protein